MAHYDYKEGKKRINDILNNKLEVIKDSRIPKDESLTFKNAYYGWVTGIFVDIRDSTTLFSAEDKEIVSKMIRTFTSEIIEILRDDDNLREIGIRGDCVFAVYTTPLMDDIYNIADNAFQVNTFIKMLNKLFDKKSFPNIEVGIGIASSQELVVKAGRKGTGINNSVWIGDAVTTAANLSALGNKNGYSTIAMSSLTYDNIIEKMVVETATAKSWFTRRIDPALGAFYNAEIIKTDFDNWISSGMPD